jgi:hypothetical protein
MKTEGKTLTNLKLEKIELEIKDLKRRWYTRPNYLIAFATLFASVITLIWTLSSGVFSKKYENLQFDKNELSYEIRKFSEKRDSIQILFYKTLDSLETLKYILKSREEEIVSNYKAQEQLIVDKLRTEDKLEAIITFYKSKLDSLTIVVAQKVATNEAEIPSNNLPYLTTEDGKVLLTEDGKAIRINIKEP